MKVCVVGTGYVGLSLSTLLSRRHSVVAVDIVSEKVDMINAGRSPIADREIEEALSGGGLDLRATTDSSECAGSDFVIVATPTNYSPATDSFDTGSVDSVIESVSRDSPGSTFVVKSTVPIGYTERKRAEGFRNLIFSPEFLREGRALYDNLHPSRIIVGAPGEDLALKERAQAFGRMLAECSEEEADVMVMGSTEAESVKLFSNTYLAMRVAYFNELDSFAETHGLDSGSVIRGVCADPRIGDWYNNPSFGYGGYCLPKDTKQLLSNYRDTPNDLIGAIVDSNDTRKAFVADRVMERIPEGGTVGVYRVSMKSGSDNSRESSILDVARLVARRGARVVVYEPRIRVALEGVEVVDDLNRFLDECDLIVANRMEPELEGCAGKVYTRDLFSRD